MRTVIKTVAAIKYILRKRINRGDNMQILKVPDSKENPIEEDDKVPSPFKIYEDKYCSRCQDYRGCIGLIDAVTIKMQNPETVKGLPEELIAFLKHILESSGMGSGQRFGLIATCMGARHHMEHRMKTHDKKTEGKKAGRTAQS